MGNRAMQAKVTKAKAERTEYATQHGFKELQAERGPMQKLNGKLIPRPEPRAMDEMLAEYRAKQGAVIELRKAQAEALKGAYRSGLRDHRSLSRYFAG